MIYKCVKTMTRLGGYCKPVIANGKEHKYFTENETYIAKRLTFGIMAYDNGGVGRYIHNCIPEYFDRIDK